MSELQRLILEDGDTQYEIYVEPTQKTSSSSGPVRDGRIGKGVSRTGGGMLNQSGTSTGNTRAEDAPRRVQLQKVHSTIQGYTQYAIGAFKNLSIAEVEELNLKFNLKISAESGLPVLANAKTEADFSIEVKCKFKDQQPQDQQPKDPKPEATPNSDPN